MAGESHDPNAREPSNDTALSTLEYQSTTTKSGRLPGATRGARWGAAVFALMLLGVIFGLPYDPANRLDRSAAAYLPSIFVACVGFVFCVFVAIGWIGTHEPPS